MPHLGDFEKGFFAKQAITKQGCQLARCKLTSASHGGGLVQKLDQHHDPTLAIGHLVDAFDAGKRRFGQEHVLTQPEQPRGIALNRRLLHPRQFDQSVTHSRGVDPTKLTRRTDALGQANQCPALGRILLAQPDEQLMREQSFA